MEEDAGLLVVDYNSGLAFAAVDYTMFAVVMPGCRKHSGVAAGVDAVGHVAGAVADAPLAAVDRRGCDDGGGVDGCNLTGLLTSLLTGLRSYCSCLGCLDLSLGCLLVRGCNRCGPGGGHGGNGG